MDLSQRTSIVKQMLLDRGFERVGVAHPQRLARAQLIEAWLQSGRAGHMDYLQRHLEKRQDPAQLLPGTRSVIVVARSYHQRRPEPPHHRSGRVAMYAWGEDYHEVIKSELWAVIDALRAQLDEPFEAKPCVDTAPIVERELAMAAGIGWIGKNTLVLNEAMGSYFFLGEIVTTLELQADAPATDHCGSCTRCLDACPTAAFPAPYEMDASRCISYLTIELREDIPEALRAGIGDWIFGCDVCQEVCPFNGHAPLSRDERLAPSEPRAWLDAGAVVNWNADAYRDALRRSAMKRAKLHMMQRNAEIVVRNHDGA